MASPKRFCGSPRHSPESPLSANEEHDAGWMTRTFRNISPGSLRAAILIQMSNIVGAGILTLPAAIAMVGMAPFVCMMIFSATLAYVNFVTLARVAHRLRESTDIEISWQAIVQHLFGSWGIPALTVMVTIDCFGAMVYFIIISGQFLSAVLPDYRHFASVQPFLPHWFLELPHGIATAFLPLVFPTILCTFKDLSSLRYISTYSVFLICCVIFIVVVNAPSEYYSHKAEDRNIVFFNECSWKDGLQMLSMCMWTFLSQWNLYNIIHGMDSYRRFRRVKKMLSRSTFGLFVMYTIFGIAGYLSFLGHTKGNLLQNYKTGNIILVVLKTIFGCQLMCVITFMVWPLRDSVVYICTEGLGMSEQRFVHGTIGYNLSGIIWIWIALACGILCPSVTVITSNLGGLCGSTCACLLPVVMYYKAVLEPRRRAIAALTNPATEGFLTQRPSGLSVPGSPSVVSFGGNDFWMTKKEFLEMGLLCIGTVTGYTFVGSQFYYGFDSDA